MNEGRWARDKGRYKTENSLEFGERITDGCRDSRQKYEDRQADRRSRSARRRTRYREIAAVLWEERLFDLFRGTVLEDDLLWGASC